MKRHQLFTTFLLLLVQLIHAQNTLDKIGLTGSSPASAAYSLRLLSTAYTGNAIQVRRSSDNTTQDIGFTINGDLDTVSLKSFVGAGDGFVTIWYDQSGNARNISQAAAGNQPTIINGGAIIREGNRPFIRFTGFISGANYKSLNLATQMTTVGHVSAVHRFDPTGDAFILGHTGAYYWHSEPPSSLISNSLASSSILSGAAWHNGESFAPSSLAWPSALSINQLEPAVPSSLTNWDNIGSDRNFYHNTTGVGGYSELIVFPAALPPADRQTLTVNQGVYFAISGLLPVTFLSFSGNIQDKTILLQWQTASEQNSREFIIERSVNGNEWKKISSMPAAGNSDEARSYTFTDHNPFDGINFYRIAQYDLDGKMSYTSVIRLTITSNLASLTIGGNPVNNGMLALKINSPTTASFYAADGKQLWKKQLTRGIETIDISRYAKGIYFIKADGIVKKIVLQ